MSGLIRLMYQGFSVDAVRQAVTVMSYDFVALRDRVACRLSSEMRFTPYVIGFDAALGIRVGRRPLLHQNDCRLNDASVRAVQSAFPRIDAWLFHFSLAGWHGNDDEPDRMEAARQQHLSYIRHDHRSFASRWFVPAASFAAFCRPTNAWMNAWAVRIDDLIRELPEFRKQALFNGGSLDGSDTVDCSWAIRDWRSAYSAPVDGIPYRSVSKAEIYDAALQAIDRVASAVPWWLRRGSLRFRWAELRILERDFRAERATVIDGDEHLLCTADVPGDLLVFGLTHPYGADTLHISGCVRVRARREWRRWIQMQVAAHKWSGGGHRTARFAASGWEAMRAGLGMA